MKQHYINLFRKVRGAFARFELASIIIKIRKLSPIPLMVTVPRYPSSRKKRSEYCIKIIRKPPGRLSRHEMGKLKTKIDRTFYNHEIIKNKLVESFDRTIYFEFYLNKAYEH